MILLILLGISLSAASGFRIFVPPFILSLMAQADYVDLPANLAWVDNPIASIIFGVATLVEIGAYYVPWIDNLLDALAAPAAVVAGTLMTGAFSAELEPAMRWTLALLAGGGAAGGVHTLMGLTRLSSSATTGGLANPVVSTTEAAAATGLSIFAIFLPLVAFLLTASCLVFIFLRVKRKRASQMI